MRLFVKLLLPALLATGQLFAQLDNYAVTRTAPSCACYTDISGTGTAVTSWRNGTSTDNNLSNTLNIGFTFPYDGGMYTQFRVSVDGFITFNTVTNTDGDDLPGYGVCSNVIEPYTYDNTKFTASGRGGTLGAVAPFYNDLFCRGNGLNTSMHYLLSGVSPNRVLTVQWRGMANDYNGDSDCSDDGGSLNFQVKLYETSGNIEFLYSTMTQTTVSCTGSGTYTISTSYTSGINSSTLTGTPTATMLLTQQTANTATFNNTVQNGLTTLPSANSRITFTRTIPAAPVAVPTCALPNYPANGATNQCINTTFSWANAGGVPTGYDVYFGTSSTPPLVSTNQGTNYYSPGTLATNTTYYWKIVPKNSFGDAVGCATWSFTTLNGDVSPISIVSSAGNPICVGTTTTLSINGGSLSEGSVFNWTSPFIFNLGCKTNLTYPLFSTNCMANSYTNTYNTAGTYQYDVFVRGCNGTTTCTHINLVVNATNNTAPTGITVSPSGTICGGSAVTLTATGGTLGTGASTQWYTGSCGGTLVGTSTTNSITVNPSTTTTYYVRRTGGTGQCPNTTTCVSTTVTVQTAIGNNSTVSAAQTICSGQTPAQLTGSAATGGNGTYTYLWESSTDGTNFSAAAGTNNTQNYSPGALTQTTWFRRNISSGSCTGVNSSTSAAIIITVSPVPAAVGAISGSTSPCPGSQAYSISSVANATGYTWSVSAGGTISSGQGTTSITVNWTTAGGPYTVSVTASNACGNTSSSKSVTVSDAPAAVGGISGNTSPCPGSEAYSIGSVANATGYVWSVSAGGTISSGQGTTSISVNWTTTGGPYTVSVTASNPCGSTSNSTAVTVQTGSLGAVGAISGNTNPCPGAQTYSISSVTNATSYVWSVSGGGTIASGQGTTSISVNWTASGGPYTVSVTASNSCGSNSNSATVAVQNATPGAVGAISGNTNPCPGAQTYSISSVTNATSYVWSVSAGGTIASGQGTTSISVNWTTSGGPYTVSVTASNACGSTSNSVPVTVQIAAPAAVGAISGNANPCPGAETYSISNVTNATSYLWSVSGGGTITSGQGTTSISINWTASGGPYTVSVTASSACGSTSNSVPVTVQNAAPGAVGTVSGNANPCPGAQTYSISSVTNATSYLWSVSAGGIIASGQGTTSISVNWTTSGGPYTVSVTASNACGSTSNSVPVTVQIAAPAAVGAISGNANPCPGAETYSISNVTNATSYLWSVSGGGTIASGQGTTSISINWTASGGPYTVSVTASSACGSTSNSVPVTVQNAAPGAVGTISGSASPCPGAETYSISSVTNATSYVWSVSGGGTISSGQGTTSISVNWTTSGGPYTVSVTASSACGSTSNSLPVTVQIAAPAAVGAISGNTNPCPGAETYAIASVTNATSYTWSVSAGGTISSGQGTTSISVNWTTSGGPYTVSVTASSTCGSTSNSIPVTVQPGTPDAVGPVSGNTNPCPGAQSYSISNVTNATSYVWSVSGGGTISSGQGTTAISINWTTSGGPYTVSVTASNACGSTSNSTPVTVLPGTPGPVGAITGNANPCPGAQTYSISNVTNASSYVWSVSGGGTIALGQGTTSIAVNWTASGGPYTVSVTASSACGSTSNSKAVTVNSTSNNPVSLAGTTTVCQGTSTTLSVVGGFLGAGAVWTWYAGGCGSGASIGTGPSITVTPATSTGYYVRAEGTCNTTNCASALVTVNDSSRAATSISGSSTICNGSSTSLSVIGGHLGVNASWYWYSAACGGTSEGTGSSINVSPTTTTTYYLRASGLCNTTTCVSFTVNVNSLPNGSISGSSTVCSGVDTALTFNFTVGTGPFSVIYTDGSNVFTRNGLSTGDTIRVLPGGTTTWSLQQITDANNCVRTTGFLGSATVTVAPLPVVSNVSVQDVLCNGGNTGTMNITAGGGTPGYTYSNDNGLSYQSSNAFTGLTAGAYQVFLQDALACKSTPAYAVTVGEPAVLAHTATPQNASCDNVQDGTITVNASGGVQPYAYSLNGGTPQPGNTFSGLGAGTYAVLVTDFNACTSSSTVTLDTAYAVYASIVSQTAVSCFGGVDGTVTVQLTGGVTPYVYSINGVQFVSSPTFTGLASGNYLVTLRDANGCTDFVNVTITQPSQLQVQIDSVFNIECSGGNTGAIYITASGGTPAYGFLWSNGATTEDVTGLIAGAYNVAVTDAKGCSASIGTIITQPFPLFLNVASYQDLLCYNDSSGSIDITANGGVPPYSFAWSNGEITEDIYGLLPGTYAATVTDANGCQQTISQAIIQPTILSSTITATPVLCAGAASGSVDLDVTGGTGPYSYFWSNGATSQDISGVSGGTYTVITQDANRCSITNSAVVTEPAPVTISLVKTDVQCNGALTGAIDITVNGGTPLITYAWSNSATTEDLNGIGAGSYSVVITDGNSCTASASAVITQPAGMVMNVSVVNVGCANGADGAIDITVQGGVFPYTYLWSNSATTEDIQHVSGGTFDVTVTDANACTITATFNITEPGAISSSIVGTDVSCNGAHDGAADLTVTGGTGPYTFLWSTFHGSEDVSGLNGGLYYVIIEDANSCEKRDSILINEASAIVLSTVVTNISCANANDGAIDLTVNGGTPTYSYAWSNLATSQDLSALPGGLYVVTVTDIRNCTATTSATIVNPSAIHTNFVVKNPLCHGDSSGRIDMIPSGGTPAYVFSWSNGANVEDLNNVPAGTYIVTITDSRSCNHVDSAVVTEPGQLFTSGVVKNVTCAGLNDGFVDITAYAGSLPYSYLWSTGQSTEDIFNIPGGDYYVTVTDANGCQAVSLYIIQEPLPLGISLAKTDVECYGAATGTIAAIPTGGSVPYYYLWNNFVTDSSINGAIAGHYVVQLTDSNGCFIYDSIDITQSTEIVIAGSVIDANCFGSASGNINVIVSGGIPTYTYNWTNASTDSSLTGVGAGTYGLTVTDSKACQKTETFTVAQPQPMQLHFVPQLPGCFGSSNGALTVDVHQGTEPYTYAWNTTPPQNSESIAGLTAGSYNVTVTDSTGCSASATKTLTQPAEVVLTLNNYNSKCFNDATGMVIVGVSGGVSPFIYTINGHSQPSDTLTGLAPGDYFLVVEDINGCKGTASFQTASPGPISVDVAVTQQVILTGMETQLVASATSNVPILHYFWSPDSVVDYSACPDPQNCTNPLVAPRTTTTFTVTVMNADSCFASDTVTVTVLNQTSAFIPTAFTPNDDQLNDRFEFDILGATNIEVSVFNRWGQRLYYNPSQANGITNLDGWDGKVNGKLAPFDTYVYQMKVTYFDIVTKDIAGTVTLMK